MFSTEGYRHGVMMLEVIRQSFVSDRKPTKMDIARSLSGALFQLADFVEF